MAQRPLPTFTPDLLFHPERDARYRHFDGAADHPFEPDARRFSAANAWWLAEAALLAYWNEEESPNNPGARQRFEVEGTRLTYRVALNEGGTQGHIAVADEHAIVTFRGTQPNELRDLIADVKFVTRPMGTAGRVHAGFYGALMKVWPALEAELATFRSNGSMPRKVWFTGHSLGAAMAVLAAHLFDEAEGVYTIGCPRVGDRAFVDAFDAKMARRSFRYANGIDLVTHLPPHGFLGYKHVSSLRHIGGDGQVSDESPMELVQSMGIVLDAQWRGLGAMSWKKAAEQAIPWLVDHTPSSYTTRLWNDLDARTDTSTS